MDRKLVIDSKTDPAMLKLILDVISDYERNEEKLDAEEDTYFPSDDVKHCSLCGRLLTVSDNDYEVSKSNAGRSGVINIICKVCSDKIEKKYPDD